MIAPTVASVSTLPAVAAAAPARDPVPPVRPGSWRERWKAERRVTPEVLNVAPSLVGLKLATPKRRALALGVDLLLVAVLASASGFWLLAGVALVLLQLRFGPEVDREFAPHLPKALLGPWRQLRSRPWAGWALASAFLGLALISALQSWNAPEATEPWERVEAKAEAADDPDAALAQLDQLLAQSGQPEGVRAALETARAEVVRQAGDAASAAASSAAAITVTGARAASPASAASSPAPAASAASVPTETLRLRRKVRQLEAQLAEARERKPLKERLKALWDELLDSVGVSFGWGFVYFSLLPAWWGGQTVGKKLFRLRTVELTGQPITVMRALKRYGGYVAALGTGGIGFLQLLWDPNAQGLHDKAAHTVVLDLRAVSEPPPAPQA